MTVIVDGAEGTPPGRAAPCIVTLAGIRCRHAALMRALAVAGAILEEVADVPAILARLDRHPLPDLVVLEWEMPEMKAVEAVQRVRESNGNPAVLVLAGLSRTAEGDDQPSRDAENLAEMETALRHLAKSLEVLIASAGLRQGGEAMPGQPQPEPPGMSGPSGLELRIDACRALWNGRRVDLSLTEFRIVTRLANSPSVDISHRDIYDIIKGEGILSGRGDEGYRANVRATIKRIRRKFLRIDPCFGAIRSYHGFGYRWDEAEAPTPAAEDPDAAPIGPVGSTAPRPER
jgi:two-component system, OmpR family, response regulator ChvI